MSTRRRISLAAVIAIAIGCGWAAQANAYVYGSSHDQFIWRANLDGTAFTAGLVGGLASPAGVAVDGRYLYWTDQTRHTIGRANLDGSGANPDFITGANYPRGVAVDGQYVYWTNWIAGTIGRARLDGSGVDQSFIGGAYYPSDIDVDDQHLYWTDMLAGTIGRARLDGSGVDHSFIIGAHEPHGVAVSGDHIYWSDLAANKISRANLDGSGINRTFILAAGTPIGMTADDRYLYWGTSNGGAIGRARLDGSDPRTRWMTIAGNAIDVAVDDGPPPVASASTAGLTFGTQALGTLGAAQSVTITNSGHGDDLEIGAVRVKTGHRDDFLVSSDDCSHSALPVNESCTLNVRFAPSAAGDRQAMLMIPSNDAASPLTVTLAGTGGELPKGERGEAGPQGPQGPKGDPGEVRVVVCIVLLRPRCETLTITGADKLPARARATVSRRGERYATGTARRGTLRLRARRHMRPGRYSLTLRYRENGRRITTRERVVIR